MPVHQLDGLNTEEVSLVNRAANKRRFLIRKGATMALDDVKALALIEKADAAGLGAVLEALVSDGEPLTDAQVAKLMKATGMSHDDYKKVRSAMKVLGPDLGKKFPQFTKVLAYDQEDAQDGGADEDSEDGADRSKAHSQSEDEDTEKAVADGKLDQGPEDGEEDRMNTGKQRRKTRKGADGGPDLSAEVADRLRKAEEDAEERKAENADLKARIQKMEDDKARASYITKAAAIGGHLPGASADDLGSILFQTSRVLKAADQAKLEAVLKAADAAIRTGVLKEIGSESADGESPTSANAELASRATALQKADPKLSLETAKYRILKTDSGLQTRINAENDTRVRKARS